MVIPALFLLILKRKLRGKGIMFLVIMVYTWKGLLFIASISCTYKLITNTEERVKGRGLLFKLSIGFNCKVSMNTEERVRRKSVTV